MINNYDFIPFSERCKIETACLKSSNEDENDSHDIKKLLSKPAIETIIYKSSFDQRTEINEVNYHSFINGMSIEKKRFN